MEAGAAHANSQASQATVVPNVNINGSHITISLFVFFPNILQTKLVLRK